MVSRRIHITLCIAAALSVAACSSDKKATSGATTTTTSSIAAVITQPVSTTQPPIQTIATVPQSTGGTGISTTTSSVAGSTGARTVTSPSDNVKLGDSGSGVEQIQTALKQACYKLSVDGQFGAVTQKYVKDFQTKHGLKADGIVGPKTWAKLSAVKAGTCTTSGTSSTSTTVKKP